MFYMSMLEANGHLQTMTPLVKLYRGILCCDWRDRRLRRRCQLCVHTHDLSPQRLHSPILLYRAYIEKCWLGDWQHYNHISCRSHVSTHRGLFHACVVCIGSIQCYCVAGEWHISAVSCSRSLIIRQGVTESQGCTGKDGKDARTIHKYIYWKQCSTFIAEQRR